MWLVSPLLFINTQGSSSRISCAKCRSSCVGVEALGLALSIFVALAGKSRN
jgi:hypothetical protein